ncbi:hypothetical protein HanXRQr2_Chr09g0368811 [Helianthus annuus]|uniref:Uncharacterized protein n=1 Tax=Helianthus annuus TaxID=4232 RepID=A0A9K3I3S4_HELAN|nr:hypothetical protein HanXRQr2_Chr09g0368811 [Helianthus annuus]
MCLVQSYSFVRSQLDKKEFSYEITIVTFWYEATFFTKSYFAICMHYAHYTKLGCYTCTCPPYLTFKKSTDHSNCMHCLHARYYIGTNPF